jgi:Transglycosylase SLT domain
MHAGAATGTRSELLLAIAKRESGLAPLASSPGSSASGLMQFTRDTWLEAVRAFGDRHGLGELVAALAAKRPEAEAEALQLRQDPGLSAALAAERLKRWRQEIESTAGQRAGPADLYLVHLLGLTGARRFLKEYRRHPRWSAVASFPVAAQANPGVFYDRQRALSLGEVHRNLTRSLRWQKIMPLEVAQAP